MPAHAPNSFYAIERLYYGMERVSALFLVYDKVLRMKKSQTKNNCISAGGRRFTFNAIFLDSQAVHGKMSTNGKCPLNSGHLDKVDIYLKEQL